MKIYVASSWRNEFQPGIVRALKAMGHSVYDFKDADGFSWREVDENWQKWTPAEYIQGLQHKCADRGFSRDMAALATCEACIMVMPCGMSASLELGWAAGAGKRTAVFVPGMREPDLMVKMADLITDKHEELWKWVGFR